MTKRIANPLPPSDRGQGPKTNESKGIESKKKYSIPFHPSLHARVEAAAKDAGLSVAAWLALAAEEKMGR